MDGWSCLKMSIYLIRHGETIEGLNKILLGHNHGTLTYNGMRQSKEAARQIEGINQIITSDLDRALYFTQLIHQITEVPYKKDNRIRERNYGYYNGELIERLIEDFGSFDFEEAPLNGEKKTDFYERVDSFYQSMMSLNDVAIVSHAGVISRLMTNFGLKGRVLDFGEVVKLW